MMKNLIICITIVLTGCSTSPAGVGIDAEAPNFELPNLAGDTVKLADFEGKVVVLEWFNHDCPFIKKHYLSKNMQELQKWYTSNGVKWLSICSSAPGKQGYYTGAEHSEMVKEKGFSSTEVLLDPEGTVGRLYGAKTTPHMFVISADGKVVYQGAIDDDSSADPGMAKKANSYVRAALDAVLAGKPVEIKSTAPYGCSVKY